MIILLVKFHDILSQIKNREMRTSKKERKIETESQNLKQVTNTKRFKRTLVYYDTDIQNCILCICVIINKRSFEPFCVGIKDQ